MRGLTVAAVAVTVLLTATGCLTPLTSQPTLTPVPTPAGPLVGVYEPGAPGGWSKITEFTGASSVRPGIVVYYSPWNDPFSTSFAQTAWDHGAYVLVQLEPKGVTLASIAAGGSDAYLRSYAGDVVAFGHPVILSFGHEMNGTWYSWGYGRTPPSTFVAAWRHVVTVFRAAGAANVTWLWTVNSITGASSSLSQWWPGAAWVGWIGIDGYYFRATDTFASVFGSTIANIRAFSSAPLWPTHWLVRQCLVVEDAKPSATSPSYQGRLRPRRSCAVTHCSARIAHPRESSPHSTVAATISVSLRTFPAP